MAFTVFAKKSDTTRRHFDLFDPETGEKVECWVDLRTELSGAELENLSLYSAMRRLDVDDAGDAGLTLDLVRLKMSRIAAWVTGWSFGPGYTPPVDEAAIAALRGPVLATLDGIILAHAEEAAIKAAPLTDPKRARSSATRTAGSKTRVRKAGASSSIVLGGSGD